jgi:hypothetical protein
MLKQNYKNICICLKHSDLWPSTDVEPISNDLVHVVYVYSPDVNTMISMELTHRDYGIHIVRQIDIERAL